MQSGDKIYKCKQERILSKTHNECSNLVIMPRISMLQSTVKISKSFFLNLDDQAHIVKS